MLTLRHVTLPPALLALALLAPAGASAQAESASGDLRAASPHVLASTPVTVSGTVDARHEGRRVAVQRADPRKGWVTERTATVRDRGAFRVRFTSKRYGTQRYRAQVVGSARAQATSPTPEVSVTVYKPQRASWYGPGFYGNTTACGIKLTRETLGVAHKTLPCGRQVALLYEGKTITVPVIDRGPYANHAQWDLTSATRSALGFDGVDTIGYVNLGTKPPAAPAPAPTPPPAGPSTGGTQAVEG